MIRAITILAAALLATGAHAASWTVDPSKSSIGFSDTQTGQAFSGEFKTYTATIDFDPAAPAAGHALVVVKTCSAHTGDTQRDEAMPGADWFNCAVMPDATYKATGFTALGGGKFTAQGSLTIRGVSKPVALPFTFAEVGKRATVVGTVNLTRTDFGVGQGVWETGQWVGLDVVVTIKLTATTT